jgi:hypothetical protein
MLTKVGEKDNFLRKMLDGTNEALVKETIYSKNALEFV